MARHLTLTSTWLFLLLTVPAALAACGDESGDEPGDTGLSGDEAGRGGAEQHLADELSALLPGTWAAEGGAAGPDERLEVTFLGQDAVSGDLALLVESERGELRPVRVILSDSQAVVEFTDDGVAFTVDAVDDDRLVLATPDGAGRLTYRRVR